MFDEKVMMPGIQLVGLLASSPKFSSSGGHSTRLRLIKMHRRAPASACLSVSDSLPVLEKACLRPNTGKKR
jgi:hypothetical protein